MSRSERWVYPQGLIDPLGEIAAPPSPLRLYERGIWDPAEQYWGEPDGMLEMCLVEVIAGGPRLQFEFEQILPGGEDLDAADPILDSIELRDSGQVARASAGSPSTRTTRRRPRLTMRAACGSRRARCPTGSVECSAGAGLTTGRSYAVCTA
jgi:hypothetical protein